MAVNSSAAPVMAGSAIVVSRLMRLMPVPTAVVPGWNARVARWAGRS